MPFIKKLKMSLFDCFLLLLLFFFFNKMSFEKNLCLMIIQLENKPS